jgi:hypothetical protein
MKFYVPALLLFAALGAPVMAQQKADERNLDACRDPLAA